VNRHHDQGKSKNQHLIGAGLQVQMFSPLSSRWKHGSIQSGMAQAELRVLHLHPKAASGRLTSQATGVRVLSPHPQWHTYSNQVTPIPTRPHLQNIQTITTSLPLIGGCLDHSHLMCSLHHTNIYSHHFFVLVYISSFSFFFYSFILNILISHFTSCFLKSYLCWIVLCQLNTVIVIWEERTSIEKMHP
jgi:hypothetical protein